MQQAAAKKPQIYIFGEVLFDYFPTGEQVLGGAPFNVAWHLQALADQPRLISRIGDDPQGREIQSRMTAWGMDISRLQVDPQHPTGRVEVSIQNQEPSYEIVPNSAYDFIAENIIVPPEDGGILYHGTLALRNTASRQAFERLATTSGVKIFLDVNLRQPWWQKAETARRIKAASWVKMNQDELAQLGPDSGDRRQDMAVLLQEFELEQLLVTCGADGATVLTSAGTYHSLKPGKVSRFVDTVGAGDAFSALYLHGLRAGWTIEKTLHHAQNFANCVIGLRGATTTDINFYQTFIATIS